MAWLQGTRLKKPLLVISLLIALSDGVFVYINYVSSRSALQGEVDLLGRQLKASFSLLLDQTATTMQQIATYVANDPAVQKQFYIGKQAIEQEGGGPGGVLAAEARDRLYNLVRNSWERTSQRYDTRQLHFHLGPGSISFLRVHRPEKFGDNLDRVRFTVVDVNKTGKPTKGFETGRVYSGIRGVVPVVYQDPLTGRQTQVGALEAGTSFTGMLAELRKVTGADCAVFLTMKHMERNVWPGYLAEALAETRPVGRYILENATNPLIAGIAQERKVYRLLNGSGNTLVRFKGTPYAVSVFPLRDYAGNMDPAKKDVGAVVFFKPHPSCMVTFERSVRINTIYAVLGFIFIEAVLILAWRYATGLLQKTIEKQTGELEDANRILRRLIDTQRLDIKTAKKILSRIEPSAIRTVPLRRGESLCFQGVVLSTNQEGGDHIFVHQLPASPGHPEGATFFGLLDQSGHEVACILRNIITAHLTEKSMLQSREPSLARRVADINNMIHTSGVFNPDEFFSAFYGQIDHMTLELEYLSAGHPPALLCREGAAAALPRGKRGANTLMAIMPDWEMTSDKLGLKPGDRLLFYSDGLLEAAKPALSNKNLRDLVEGAMNRCRGRDLEVFLHEVLASAIQTTGYVVDAENRLNTSPDDISLLLAEVQAPAS